ncbi:MAG: hypothetical protein IPN42_05020 [Methylococcaceae bacterium]|nr:hypothetical protein [Methylococcaceae bacterium]
MKNRTNATRKSMLWVAGLSMSALLTVLGGNVALAKGGNSTQNPTHNGDPVQSHNKSNKGLKTPHSARKQAAKRLQAHHQKEHQQKLQKWAESHHGYSGLGEAGDSFNNNPKPAQKGGAK